MRTQTSCNHFLLRRRSFVLIITFEQIVFSTWRSRTDEEVPWIQTTYSVSIFFSCLLCTVWFFTILVLFFFCQIIPTWKLRVCVCLSIPRQRTVSEKGRTLLVAIIISTWKIFFKTSPPASRRKKEDGSVDVPGDSFQGRQGRLQVEEWRRYSVYPLEIGVVGVQVRRAHSRGEWKSD